MLKKLDFKTIIILVLGVILVLTIIFRPSKSVDKYEAEIKALHDNNTLLTSINDSITKVNLSLDKDIKNVKSLIVNNEKELGKNKDTINKLKNKRNETLNNTNNLDAISVSSGITKYLQGRN